MATLRVLIIEDTIIHADGTSDPILVGIGIEKYLAVQGSDVDDIKRRIKLQLSFYTDGVEMVDTTFGPTIDLIPEAPQEYYQQWADLDFVAHRIVMSY